MPGIYLVDFNNMNEKAVENYLIKKIKDKGEMTMKILSTHINGLPDRICTKSDGKVIWVEVKAPNEKPRRLQRYRHNQLREHGQIVEVVSTTSEVDDMIQRHYETK